MEEDCSAIVPRHDHSLLDKVNSTTNSNYLINEDLRQAIRALHAAYQARTSGAIKPKVTQDGSGGLIHMMGDLIDKATPMGSFDTKRGLRGSHGDGQAHRQSYPGYQSSPYRLRPRMSKENCPSFHQTEKDSVSSFSLIRSRMSEWVSKLFARGNRPQNSSSAERKKLTRPSPINNQAAVKRSTNHHVTNRHNARERRFDHKDGKRIRAVKQMRTVHLRYIHQGWEEIPEIMLGENENFGKSKRKKNQPERTDGESNLETLPTEKKEKEKANESTEKENKKRKSSMHKLLDLAASFEVDTVKKEDSGDIRELLWRPRRASSRRISEVKTDPTGAVANVENRIGGGSSEQKVKPKARESISLKSESRSRDLEMDKESEATIVPRSNKKERDKKSRSSEIKQEDEAKPQKLDTENLGKKVEHAPQRRQSRDKRKELRLSKEPSVEESTANEEEGAVDHYHEGRQDKKEHRRSSRGHRRSRSRGSGAESPRVKREYERQAPEREYRKNVERDDSVGRSTVSKRQRRDLSHTSTKHDKFTESQRKRREHDDSRPSEENEDTSPEDRCSEYCSCGSTKSARSRDRRHRRHGHSSSEVSVRSRRQNEWKRANDDHHRKRQKARSMPSRLHGRHDSDDTDECTCDSGSVRHFSLCSRDSRQCSCSCECESLRCHRQIREPRCSRANVELIDALSEVCSELESRLYDELPRGGREPKSFRNGSRSNLAKYLSPDTLTLLESEQYAPRSRHYNYAHDYGYNPRLPPLPPRRHVPDGEVESPMCHCSPSKQTNVAPTQLPMNNPCPVFYPVPQPVPVPTVTVHPAPPSQVWYPTSVPAANVLVRPSQPPMINAQQLAPAPAVSSPFMMPNITTPVVQSSMLFPSFAYCQRL